MGSQVSASHCVNIEFLEDEKRENFLQTLGQCSKDDRVKITKKILSEHTDIKNFVIMSKGPRTTPRLWHSENIFVCAISTPNPPIDVGFCAYHQYHSLPFMSIHVDQISYCHMVYFMNRVRFYLEPKELLECILFCNENTDPECLNYVSAPNVPPKTITPDLMLAIPYDTNTGQPAEATFRANAVMDRQVSNSISSSSFAPCLSEPSSVNGFTSSSSMIAGLSEPSSMYRSQNASSSVLGGFSEPSSMSETGSSSAIGGLTEPSSVNNPDYMSSLSSVLNPISEPAGMSSASNSGRSSFFGQISEPSGMSLSNASGRSSQFGLISEPMNSSSSATTQFGMVSEPSAFSSQASSFFGLVSEPTNNSSATSFFGLVSEPNSSDFLSRSEGRVRTTQDREISSIYPEDTDTNTMSNEPPEQRSRGTSGKKKRSTNSSSSASSSNRRSANNDEPSSVKRSAAASTSKKPVNSKKSSKRRTEK